MDQFKIGRFIAERRKSVGMTQMQLAERMNITDRAVSKWETGKAMPDSSIMLELCGVLKITVNDLLSGEVVTMENYNRELENNLLEMVKQKEESDKRLLRSEVYTGIIIVLNSFVLILLAGLAPMQDWLRAVFIVFGLVLIFVWSFFAVKIEQSAGYYECGNCGNRYVPSYKSVIMARHIGRKRFMRCPKCEQKTWQKKVISKK